jgi:predicted MFS family arabinose efflux permease
MIFGTLISWILSIWVMGPLGIIAALLLILRYRELKRQSKRRSQRKYANRRNFYQ